MAKYSNADGGDVQVFESGGVHLKVGAIADGQALRRNGTIIDSVAIGAGGDVSGPGGAVVQDVIVSWDVAAASPYTVNETYLLHISDAATYSGIQSTLANADLVVQPNGTGALIAGPPPDGTAVGGNARGNYAVDLQLQRTGAGQVAATDRSVLLGGHSNAITAGTDTVIIGGQSNTISTGFPGYSGIFAGDRCFINNYKSAICGGQQSTISGGWSFIGGGTSHLASGTQSAIVGGTSHIASATDSGCFAGNNNNATNTGAAALGGLGVTASGIYSVAAGGSSNQITGSYGVALGGQSHVLSATHCGAIGGQSSYITSGSTHAVILGGNACRIDNNSTFSGILSGVGSDVGTGAGAPCAVTLGGRYNLASRTGAAAMGFMAQADHPATFAFSGNNEAQADAPRGKSQGQLVHLDQRTTDATPAVLTSCGLGAAGTELAVPTNTAFSITGTCLAWNETDSTATKWNIDILVLESAAALTFVSGSGAQAIIATNDAGTPVLSIGSTGTNINFNITGIAAKNIRWSCSLVLARAAT